jgi:hypothetical protein
VTTGRRTRLAEHVTDRARAEPRRELLLAPPPQPRLLIAVRRGEQPLHERDAWRGAFVVRARAAVRAAVRRRLGLFSRASQVVAPRDGGD